MSKGGVTRSERKMASKDSDQREIAALFKSAERYEEAREFRKAFRCYETAALLGNHSGQLNLGNYYAWGKGVKRNLETAAYWYRKAYRGGVDCAARNLAIDRRNQGNVRSATLWFRRAAAMGDGESYVELAKIYRDRRGGRRAAEVQLTRALKLDRDHISDDARKKAEALLEALRSGNRGDVFRFNPRKPASARNNTRV